MAGFEAVQYVRLHYGQAAKLRQYLLVLWLGGYTAWLLIGARAHLSIDHIENGHVYIRSLAATQAFNRRRNISSAPIDLSMESAKYCKLPVTDDGPAKLAPVQYGTTGPLVCDVEDAQALLESSGGEAFVRTAWRSKRQQRACGLNAANCAGGEVWTDTPNSLDARFALMPERLTFIFEHSLRKSELHGNLLAGSSRHFNGRLQFDNGSTYRTFSRHHEKADDAIPLVDLLVAAGVDDLDARSDYSSHTSSGRATFRQTGVALDVHIRWSNVEPWFPFGLCVPFTRGCETSSGVSYTYKVTRTPGTRAQRTGIAVDEDGETRTIFQRAGVALHVHVSGQVGQWSIFSVLFGVVFPVVVGVSVVDVMMYMIIVYVDSFEREREHMIVDIHDQDQQPRTPTSGTRSPVRLKSE
jgi:hypothetical protein